MSQVSKRPLSPAVTKQIYQIFTDVISETHFSKDVDALLTDFLTPAERIMLPKRLCIAYFLLKGYDHRSIAAYLKVSFTTINRVSTTLKNGGQGYKLILERVSKHDQLNDALDRVEKGFLSFMASLGGPSRVWNNMLHMHRAKG